MSLSRTASIRGSISPAQRSLTFKPDKRSMEVLALVAGVKLLDGGLFTRDFLIEGICGTEAWTGLGDEAVNRVAQDAKALFTSFLKTKNPAEAVTEKDLIWPLLGIVGWTEMFVQPNLSVKARDDVPDALLFKDIAAKTAAAGLLPWQRFQHGLCVVEAKRWGRVLDRQEARRKAEEGVPSTQMLRYLRRVDDVT